MSRGERRIFSSFLLCSWSHSFVRPAPRAFFRPDRKCPSPSRAAAVKAGRSFSGHRRLGLYGRCARRHAAAIGCGATLIRGEPAIGRDRSREPRLYSVEPAWGPDHEAVIRFCGQGSEAAGPFSQRHCSHSRVRIAATSDRHRLPAHRALSGAEACWFLSRSIVSITPPVAARRRPAPRRS